MKKRMILSSTDPLETASEWALRAEIGLSPRDDARLEAWLYADPRHRAAYDAILEADGALARHGADDELMIMRRAALKARPEGRPSMRAWAAGVVAVLAIGVAGWWSAPHLSELATDLGVREPWTSRYATAIGERATVALADGSVVVLNTDSTVEAVFDRRTRTVRLLKGQAMFTVAHDPERPFEVLADDRRVTAVGTAFDVLLLPDSLRVAMLDGVVRVSSNRSTPSQTLSKGEVMTATSGGSVTVRKADTARLAGWRDGVILFEETPLGEAASEMSRYTRRPIVVADAGAAALRVSGAFRIAEAEAFAQTMADIFPISAKHSVDGRTVLASEPA